MGPFPVRRLTCSKCGGQFDYELVPTASFTAMRLGRSRYMRCPLCQRFAMFRLSGGAGTTAPPSAPSNSGPLPSGPR